STFYVVSAFFFKSEDGIRDRNVTGVQTCALPISNPSYVNMHDDYETIQDVYDRNVKKYGKVYVYTLVDGEGRSIILLKGKHIVNRLGYYMTLEDIEFKVGELEM